MDDAFLLILALYGLIGVLLLVLVLRTKRRMRRGRPAARDLHPYEVAYLHGGRRHAIAAALTALKLDGAVEVLADGRLRATSPVSDGPRAAHTPLDAAVYRAVGVLPDASLAKVTHEGGVLAALEQLRKGLIALGMIVPEGRRMGVELALWGVRGWLALGAAAWFIGNESTFGGSSGAEGPGYSPASIAVAILLFGSLLAALVLGHGGATTTEGVRALDRARETGARLDPAAVPSYAGLAGPDVLLGVALFGTAALMAWDPMFAQTAGLGRYLTLTGVGTVTGPTGTPACGSAASVCSSGSCGGGGGGGGGGCGGGGGGCGGGGG